MPESAGISASDRGPSPYYRSLQIVLPFVVIGGLWIAFSDKLIGLGRPPTDWGFRFTISRFGFLLMMGGVLWFLLGRTFQRLFEAMERAHDSEARLEDLYENAPDIYLSVDLATKHIIQCNQALVKAIGRSKEQILNRSVFELYHSESILTAERAFETLLAQGEVHDVELRLNPINGEALYVSISASSVRDASGRICHTRSIWRDISRRKEAERRLAAASIYNELLLKYSSIGIATWRETGEIVAANPALLKSIGATPEKIKTQNFLHLDSWKQSGLLAAAKTAFATNQPQRTETLHVSTFGKNVWLSCHFIPFDFNGERQLLFQATDITPLKETQASLEISNQHLRAMFDGARDAIILADPDTGLILDANREAETLLNRPRSEIVGMHQTEMHPPERNEESKRWFQNHVQKPDEVLEAEVVTSDGRCIPVEISASFITLPQGRVFQGVFRDVSLRKQTDEKLRKLWRAVEQSPASILITNAHGDIEYVNPRFTQVTGYAAAEVIGQNPRMLKSGRTPPEVYREIWKTITAGGEWRGELHNRKRTGELFWESALISPIRDAQGRITHFLGIQEDITEKKKLEQQFLRSQRMESLGTLASGVAHDLNNILAPILISIECLRAIASRPDDLELLDLLKEGVRRGVDITRQLLVFGRGMPGQRAELQARSLLKEIAKIIKETFPKTIELAMDFSPDLWTIHADPTQIHQVLLNLCVNARDAMPEGGKLSLEAKNTELKEKEAAAISEGRPGNFVVLKVSDTGTGIPQEIIGKIFDPFFTTKELGKGTGLGLSTVLGIVKSHGGFLRVQSGVGEGTRFEIFLPAVEADSVREVPVAGEEVHPGAGEFILLVDDEEAIRTAARKMLKAAGYRVMTARNGAEGLVIYSAHKKDIRVVVTDMAMPLLDGNLLVRTLRQMSPDLPILGMSGLPVKSDDLNHSWSNVNVFLSKPFSREQLLTGLSRLTSNG